MQLTILSEKLPSLSTEQFIHEFRVVHAEQTKTIARSLGIISQYVQGLALSLTGQESLRNQPMSGPQEPIESFAQLSWPALEVMQGSFQTQGYKDSAGKHIFAQPRMIFLTNQLEPEVEHMNKNNTIRLVCVLNPLDPLDSNFRKSWDKHASFCRTICANYQRNQVLKLDPEQINIIFFGTQFPKDAVMNYGGYEEFLFASIEDSQAFCKEHGEELGLSYSEFTTKDSYCVGFDVTVQYDHVDRGYQQIIAGAIVGTILRFKVFFGI